MSGVLSNLSEMLRTSSKRKQLHVEHSSKTISDSLMTRTSTSSSYVKERQENSHAVTNNALGTEIPTLERENDGRRGRRRAGALNDEISAMKLDLVNKLSEVAELKQALGHGMYLLDYGQS